VMPAVSDRVQGQDEVEAKIGWGNVRLLACIGGLDRTGGRPDGGPARVGAAQRNCVVAGGTKAGGDRSRAGGGIDGQRLYPGRAIRADLEMPVVITGQTHFSTTRPVGLIEQGCGVGGAGLVE